MDDKAKAKSSASESVSISESVSEPELAGFSTERGLRFFLDDVGEEEEEGARVAADEEVSTIDDEAK